MIAKWIIGVGLSVVIAGCTTPEEQATAQIENMFAGGERNFGQMCGALAEIMLENYEELQFDNVQARIASSSIVQETDSFVDAEARLKLSASGYYSSGLDIVCRFDSEPDGNSRWHNLQAVRFAGHEMEEGEIDDLNNLGSLMALAHLAAES